MSRASKLFVTLNVATEKQAKERKDRLQGLRDGTPNALAWAKRVGLTHWHAIGFGCGPRCLAGVGEQLDPEAVNFARVYALKVLRLTDEKKVSQHNPNRQKARRAAVDKETRLRKAGVSDNTGRY